MLFTGLDIAMRELALFAATGFLLLGASDLLVDLGWLAVQAKRRLSSRRPRRLDQLPRPAVPGRIAIFVPAWDEADVIAPMLRHALRSLTHADYLIYVGCYRNDPDTIAAVKQVRSPWIRLVVGPVAGPTTKADCLNRLWRAMIADERTSGVQIKAVVLHDAEDVVDADELAVFDALIGQYDMVQLPVLPLRDPGSRWIAGHYADEFAEAHGKEMVVREAVGASIPSAGVGCAFSRGALDEVAAANGGDPFDADSLTEDYELGLRLGAMGRRSTFARVRGRDGRTPIVTREFFPATLDAAVAQKARWMTGIALAGWDRLGWSGGLAETWMRLRDRQSVLAALCLAAGYCAGAIWLVLRTREILLGLEPAPVSPTLALLLKVNLALLLWRLAWRVGFAARAYGWREGLRSLPRIFLGNAIAIYAAWRALMRYRSIRRTGRTVWGKTAHAFPAEAAAE